MRTKMKKFIPIIVFVPFLLAFGMQTFFLSASGYEYCSDGRRNYLQVRGGIVCVSDIQYYSYIFFSYAGPILIFCTLAIYLFRRKSSNSRDADRD